jgi:hypothetical protein
MPNPELNSQAGQVRRRAAVRFLRQEGRAMHLFQQVVLGLQLGAFVLEFGEIVYLCVQWMSN